MRVLQPGHGERGGEEVSEEGGEGFEREEVGV